MTLDRLLDGLPLKHLPRAGWLRVGVVDPETVASHSWGMAWLVLRLCPPTLDRGRCLALAIIHDLPEVRVGDLTPHDGVPKSTKHALEAEAAALLLEDRPDLLDLVRAYAAQTTPEARFVRDLDKLDMALQALVYADRAETLEFVDSALKSTRSPEIRALIIEVRARLSTR
jgi:putative hydrolase of HD superfamily